MGKRSKKKRNRTEPQTKACVPRSIVQQAMDFTAPRGRMEMGGLLIGHIDNEGVTHVVTGFFPKQIRATPGYCEFDGSWVAIAASACRPACVAGRAGGPLPRSVAPSARWPACVACCVAATFTVSIVTVPAGGVAEATSASTTIPIAGSAAASRTSSRSFFWGIGRGTSFRRSAKSGIVSK